MKMGKENTKNGLRKIEIKNRMLRMNQGRYRSENRMVQTDQGSYSLKNKMVRMKQGRHVRKQNGSD